MNYFASLERFGNRGAYYRVQRKGSSMILGFVTDSKGRSGFRIENGRRVEGRGWPGFGSGSQYLHSYLYIRWGEKDIPVSGEARSVGIWDASRPESLRRDSLEQSRLGQNRMRQNGMSHSNDLPRIGAAQ